VDPRAGLDDVDKRTFLLLPGLEPRLLGRPAVTSRYTDCAIRDSFTLSLGVSTLVLNKRACKKRLELTGNMIIL
jgi:hypothetical protein